jgi:ABC-type nitrate/sulfonate/bicarbonate transport system permease component
VSAPATAPQTTAVRQQRAQLRSATLRATLRALGRSSLTAVITLAIVLAVWLAVVYLFGISEYVVRGPVDVGKFLVTDEEAGANRVSLGGYLGVTLGHAGSGFLAGLIVAILVAILFRLSKGAEAALMPFALLLRSVPLVALAPVIFIIVGLGSEASVPVIGGIVVLFPALVNIAVGLKRASPQMLDVVHVYGGSSLTAILKVALPSAVPSLFAAIRISVPGAITGALLAEQLSTGDGIGSAAVKAASQAKFDEVWAYVVSVTLVSLLLYMVVQIIESIVLARMGMVDRT